MAKLREKWDISVLELRASDFGSREYGSNESRMKHFFEQAVSLAKEKKVLVLMDELETLCPNRAVLTLSEGTRRLVSTMLAQLDAAMKKVDMKQGLAFIGLTNQVSALDPAIRQPGRLDRELELSAPDTENRKLIVRALLKDRYQSGDEESLDAISQHVSDLTHGYVASDIRALCQEAFLLSVGNLKQQSSSQSPAVSALIPYFNQASKKVKPSAIREVLIEVPHVLWSDIGGQELTKQLLIEAVEWQLKHSDAFERMGIRPPKGILLYGPPGCSKTMMAKALATEAKLNFLAVRGPELYSKWVGESERAVREVFRKARSAAPSVVFFDEIDGLATERGASGGGGVHDRVLSQLLNELDGMQRLDGVTVVAATNRPDILDRALLRPGRIDRMIYIRPPDVPARRQILSIYLNKIKGQPKDASSQDQDLPRIDEVAEFSEGYSGAELASVCREAAYVALQESMEATHVRHAQFIQALQNIKPRLTKEMLQFYENFEKQHRL